MLTVIFPVILDLSDLFIVFFSAKYSANVIISQSYLVCIYLCVYICIYVSTVHKAK